MCKVQQACNSAVPQMQRRLDTSSIQQTPTSYTELATVDKGLGDSNGWSAASAGQNHATAV